VDEATKKIIYTLSSNPALNFLKKRNTLLEFDMLNLASIVFNVEKAYKMGKRIDRVTIPISAWTETGRDIDKIKILLQDLFLYVLLEDIEVDFDIVRPHRKSYAEEFKQCDNVCLFSGGVDSLSGLLTAKNRFSEVHGVSVIHGDQPWHSHILEKLNSGISKVEEIPIHTLYAPKMSSTGYSQLRGFLYALYGAIFVSLLKAENLIIAECGPTMYQPLFAPLDSTTMTTHPYVLKTAKEIIEIFLKRKINIIIPYENMTKSEVIIASPYKQFFKDTHSCITLRFGNNEGTCYGCVIRRLGFLVAGVEDTKYTYDPIGKEHKVDNLVSLLRFSYDVLFDYPHLPDYSKENIELYGKKDLFKRFALDNFVALYIYKNKYGKLNHHIETLYNEAMARMTVDRIEKRIFKVRSYTFKPNFKKFVG